MSHGLKPISTMKSALKGVSNQVGALHRGVSHTLWYSLPPRRTGEPVGFWPASPHACQSLGVPVMVQVSQAFDHAHNQPGLMPRLVGKDRPDVGKNKKGKTLAAGLLTRY